MKSESESVTAQMSFLPSRILARAWHGVLLFSFLFSFPFSPPTSPLFFSIFSLSSPKFNHAPLRAVVLINVIFFPFFLRDDAPPMALLSPRLPPSEAACT